MNHKVVIIENENKGDYELIDAGGSAKLERYGNIIFSRPDPEALFSVGDEKLWNNADGKFTRVGQRTNWNLNKNVPESWNIKYGNFVFKIMPTSFKHTGIFPEQIENWKWSEKLIKKENRNIKVLNLFAYTGGASMACAEAGAEVAHIDASKSAVAWAKENARLSGFADSPIRYIIEDCLVFLKKEIKRGNRYDGIIMDPPAFGHGPNNELWKIEEDFLNLFNLASSVLSDKPLFFIINSYASGYSSLVYRNSLQDLVNKFGGEIETGELAIKSTTNKILPTGIYARWKKD